MRNFKTRHTKLQNMQKNWRTRLDKILTLNSVSYYAKNAYIFRKNCYTVSISSDENLCVVFFSGATANAR